MDTNIPTEVVVHLCDYLSFEDRRQAALVNSQWNYATERLAFWRLDLLSFQEPLDLSSLGSDEDKLNSARMQLYNDYEQMLFNSKRKIFNLKLQFNGLPQDLSKLFTNLGDRIHYLDLGGLEVFSDMDLDGIIGCYNLKTLKLSQLLNISLTKKSRSPLINLKSIFFKKTDLSDLTFTIFMTCFPNLEDLGISYCDLTIWPHVVRRFYPEIKNFGDKVYDCDCVFTIENVIHYINTTKSIKNLRLEHYPEVMLHLIDDIKLNHLTLGDVYKVYDGGIPRLVSTLRSYKSLQELFITCCPCFLSAISKLHNLKHLKIKIRTNIHDPCVNDLETCFKHFSDSLRNMSHLKTFAICKLSKIEPCPFNTFLIPKRILRSLTTLKSPIGDCSPIVNLGTNLTTLKIYNGKILTEHNLVTLFKQLTMLRYLNIKDCVNLTDKIIMDSPISNLKGLKKLQILGSKLTYQCLPHFQLIDLKDLFLDNLSMKVCIDQDNLSDFESCIKQFGSCVPSLINCKLIIKDEDKIQIYNLGLDLFTSDYKILLISFFKRLKYFDLLVTTD